MQTESPNDDAGREQVDQVDENTNECSACKLNFLAYWLGYIFNIGNVILWIALFVLGIEVGAVFSKDIQDWMWSCKYYFMSAEEKFEYDKAKLAQSHADEVEQDMIHSETDEDGWSFSVRYTMPKDVFDKIEQEYAKASRQITTNRWRAITGDGIDQNLGYYRKQGTQYLDYDGKITWIEKNETENKSNTIVINANPSSSDNGAKRAWWLDRKKNRDRSSMTNTYITTHNPFLDRDVKGLREEINKLKDKVKESRSQ